MITRTVSTLVASIVAASVASIVVASRSLGRLERRCDHCLARPVADCDCGLWVSR